MSIFKTTWFVLKIKKIRDKESLYTIFSYDFWIINVNKKNSNKEKQLDLWYIANFEIETKGNIEIQKIKNVIIKSQFLSQNRSFDEINLYLLILAYINNNVALWEAVYEIFDIINILNSWNTIDDIKLILAFLKIKSIIWELNEENDCLITKKILKFIISNKFEDIIKLKWINDDIKNKLRKNI